MVLGQKLLFAFLFLVFLPGQAYAQVELSQMALYNLEDFERHRAQTCSQKQNTEQVDFEINLDFKEVLMESLEREGAVLHPSHPVEIEGAPAGKARYYYTGLVAGLSCPLDYSISYLLPPLEPECQQIQDAPSPLCTQYLTYQSDKDSDARYLFANAFNTLLLREEHYPWQVITSENGPAGKIALTLIQKANVSLKITAYLEMFPVDDLLGIRKKKIRSRLKKLDLNLVQDGYQYFPMLKFEIGAAGISDSNYYLEIYRTSSANPETGELYAIYGREMEQDQFWLHAIFLYAVAEKDFRKATHFIIKAFPSKEEKDTPLLEIKISNAGFSAVWDQLLAHYRAVSPKAD